MIKIYSDQSFCPPSFSCHMLLPFWGQQKDENDPDANRFDKYIKEGKEIFKLTSFEEADWVVYPYSPTGNPKQFLAFQELTKSKPLIVFFNDDSDIELNYRENTYIFRTSFYKSKRRPTEFAIPGWSNDWGKFLPKIWEEKPTVSFCGQIYPLDVRKASIDSLIKSSKITTNFLIRDKFWAGWLSNRRKEFGQKVRQEFIQNISDGDYILCARGGGNFSYRVYETMMSGRIPLIVNTDCVFPYDFIIDWKNIFPIVEKSNINYIAEILLEFHNSLSPQQFIEKQDMARDLWDKWISPCGFFSNLHRHLEAK